MRRRIAVLVLLLCVSAGGAQDITKPGGGGGGVATGLNTGATTNMTGLLLGNGATIGAYSGTSCTNQFPRSLSASGGATCASIANTDLANSSMTIAGHTVALGGTQTLASTDLTDASALALAATTITINGTTGQITSSAGAQSLAANRVWTLSLPTAVTGVNSVTASAATDLTLNAGSGNQNVVLAPTGTGAVNVAQGITVNLGGGPLSDVTGGGGSLGSLDLLIHPLFTITDNGAYTASLFWPWWVKTSAAFTGYGIAVLAESHINAANTQNWTAAGTGFGLVGVYASNKTRSGSTGTLTHGAAIVVSSDYQGMTITNSYGIQIITPSRTNPAAITNRYQLFIDDPNSVATNTYALYVKGQNNPSVFEGTVIFGIGDKTATLTGDSVIGPRGTGSNVVGVNTLWDAPLGTGNAQAGATLLRGAAAINASGTTRHTASTLISVGNPQTAALGLVGIIDFPAFTHTDFYTAASGTVASTALRSISAGTLAANNANVVATDVANLYVAAPLQGTNVTATNLWSTWHAGNVRIDGELQLKSVVFTSLGTINNRLVYCSDCDPAAVIDSTCTHSGAQTGALAFRVNGAWKCIS